MSRETGQELLVAALGPVSALARDALAVEPFRVPYEQLAHIDGWFVWLGDSPAPAGLDLLPAPGPVLAAGPRRALAATTLVATNYAARRGARSPEAMREVLRRESPVAVMVASNVDRSVRPLLDEVSALAIPIVTAVAEPRDALLDISPFAARRLAHAAPLGRRHDPALSFQTVKVVDQIGGNPLSSFVLHHEGERDGITVVGDVSQRVGIEVGLQGAAITIEATEAIEREAAIVPSFLDGVTSRLSGHSLEIGWSEGAAPSPTVLGETFRVWLKALYGATLVDVRIAFAPPRGRSAFLTEMRARAQAFRRIRAATIAGHPDPLAVLDSGHDKFA